MATGQRPSDPYEKLTPEWAEMVRAELKRRGLSYEKFAKKIGVSKGTVSNIINLRHPSSRAARKAAEYLGLPPPGFKSLREFLALEALEELRAQDPAEYNRLLEEIEIARRRLIH